MSKKYISTSDEEETFEKIKKHQIIKDIDLEKQKRIKKLNKRTNKKIKKYN